MPQRKSKPITWRPRGVSDNVESSESFQGAMSLLTNMIPHPSTKGVFECRPAATVYAILGQFEVLHPISVMQVFGDYAYGMVQSDLNTAYDVPFVIDLVARVPVLVSGFSIGTNTPYSQPSTGTWVPPTMDAVGSKIVVTHPGFSGTGFFFGYFDISTPSAPVWHGGNCSGASFPGFLVVPTFVRQYSGRACFIHNYPTSPAVILSDVNNPLTNSAGGIVPILTFGDTQLLTALGGLPLENQLGGIIQSLMVFKGASNIYQITGDPSLGTLALNTLNIPTGTLAPRSVVPTPKGLGFISPDGFRIINFDARVSDPIGIDGQGVTLPFINAYVPSRISASANGQVYRVTVQNGSIFSNPIQEWWYDFGRSIWSGPHTCAMTSIAPYKTTFIGVLYNVNGQLWQSDYVQNLSSTFVENGVQLAWTYLSVLFPDTDRMTQNWMTETTIDMQVDAEASQILVTAKTQTGSTINSVPLTVPDNLPIWGTMIWGGFTWGGDVVPLAPIQIPWTQPLSFARCQISLQGNSTGRMLLGALHMRYTDTGIYINYTASNMATSNRTQATQNTTFYVAATGSDVSGAGTLTSPWASYQHAFNVIATQYDGNGFTALIQGDGSTFTSGISKTVELVGWSGLTIDGGTGGGINSSGSCFYISTDDSWLLQNFTLVSAGDTIFQDIGAGKTSLGPNINFGTSGGAHFNLRDGFIFINNNYTISGAGLWHIFTFGGGAYLATGSTKTITITGTPNFSQYFAYVEGGMVDVSHLAFSGSATGTRYLVYSPGCIKTAGVSGSQGGSFLPGNVDGVTMSGGVYT